MNDYKDLIESLEICCTPADNCTGCLFTSRGGACIEFIKRNALEALKCFRYENKKLAEKLEEVIEDIRTQKKLCDEKQTQIEAMQQYVNELENKLAAMQKDERYHEKEITAAELLRNREVEIEELRHYMWRLESENRAFQEAIAALTLERLGIKENA